MRRRPLLASLSLLMLATLGCGIIGFIENPASLTGPSYWTAETATPVPTVTVFLGTSTPGLRRHTCARTHHHRARLDDHHAHFPEHAHPLLGDNDTRLHHRNPGTTGDDHARPAHDRLHHTGTAADALLSHWHILHEQRRLHWWSQRSCLPHYRPRNTTQPQQ